jgi:hypothetical protein
MFGLKYMLGLESRTLIFDALNWSLEFSHLVSDFLFNAVNVSLIILDLDLNLILETFHILSEKSIDNFPNLSFVNLLHNLSLFHIHIQLVI